MATNTPTKPANTKPNGNGQPDQPDLTAQIAAGEATLEQLEKQLADARAKVEQAKAQKQREAIAALMADGKPVLDQLVQAWNEGDPATVIRLATELRTKATDVARAQNISTRGTGTGRTRGDGSQTGSTANGGLQQLVWNVLARGFMDDPTKAWTNSMISNDIFESTGTYKPSTGAVGNNAVKAVSSGWAVETDVNGTFAVVPTQGILAQAKLPGTVTPSGDVTPPAEPTGDAPKADEPKADEPTGDDKK